MSPKNCSLAFDVVEEVDDDQEGSYAFQPQLNLVLGKRHHTQNLSTGIDDGAAVPIAGCLTVSF